MASEYKLEYGNFSRTFKTTDEYNRQCDLKIELELRGWTILGWESNETLFVTGAWKHDKATDYVFCMTDSEPQADSPLKFPEPFFAPEPDGAVAVLVYRGPFKPSVDGDVWKMDGQAPVNVNEDDTEVMTARFENYREANHFCEWLLANARPIKTVNLVFKPVDIEGEKQLVFLILQDEACETLNVGEWTADGDYEQLTLRVVA